MHRYTRLLLASLTATALLALAVGTATANRLSTNRQTIRVTWTSLQLKNTARTEETVLCATTLEGSFHSSTISKVREALIGYITRAFLTPAGGNSAVCTGGTATIVTASLPWHIRYRSFTGTLPRITGINLGLIGVDFIIRAGTTTCEAKTEAEHPATGTVNVNESTGVATSLTPDESTRIPLRNVGSEFLCPFGSGFFAERSQTLTLLGTTEQAIIRLI